MKNTATPQDTFDHIFGSGGQCWGWHLGWHDALYGVDRNGNVVASWVYRISMEDGNGDEDKKDSYVTKFITHNVIMEAAKELVIRLLNGNPPRYMSGECMRQCALLLFYPEAADFDAGTADEFLQYIMLGEVVFG